MPITDDLQILLVDHRPERSRLIRATLDAAPGIRCVAGAADGARALQLARELDPDLLIMSIDLPRMDGLTTLRLCSRFDAPPVLALVDPTDAESGLDALALGAASYVLAEELSSAGASDLRSRLERRLARADDELFETTHPTGVRTRSARILHVPAGHLGALQAWLSGSRGDPAGDAVFAVLDAPAWFLDPVAARMHRLTPWRVLRARAGDVLSPGHVHLASVEDGLTPVAAGHRIRLRSSGQAHWPRDVSIDSDPGVWPITSEWNDLDEGRRAA